MFVVIIFCFYFLLCYLCSCLPCFGFFQKQICPLQWICYSLEINVFCIDHLWIFFLLFLIVFVTFSPSLILEETIRWNFLMWSLKWNLYLNWPCRHFFLLPSQDNGKALGRWRVESNIVSQWHSPMLSPLVAPLCHYKSSSL